MKYGLIGEHLGHSFSVNIHNAFGNPDYGLFELAPNELSGFIKEKNFLGINVTIPYKESVIPLLDEISPEAQKIGAVNTIINRNGKLCGYNTDFYGMKALAKKESVDFSEKTVYILGSSGTSKTAFAVSESLGAKEIIRVSRAQKEGYITYSEAEKLGTAEIIINATPVGMFPKNEEQPLVLKNFPKLSGVLDAIYNPLRTELVLEAKSLGIKSSGGLYMLVAQAAAAEEMFFEHEIPEEKTEEVYKALLAEKENIVLSGMPASGKSTLGKELAKRLGKEFADTDLLIEQRADKAVAEIFSESGEAEFRHLESETIAEISKKNGMVIALGGGAVLKPENVKNLRQNGKIIFLNRPLEQLETTASRPLSSDREALKKRFEERFETYCETADFEVKIGSDIEENLERILEKLK